MRRIEDRPGEVSGGGAEKEANPSVRVDVSETGANADGIKPSSVLRSTEKKVPGWAGV